MIDTNEAADTSAPSLFNRFYAVQVNDDDILEMAELLESVCDGLGTWFLDIDEEFQKDLLAGGRLFWERRKAPCQCAGNGKAKVRQAKRRHPRPSPSLNGKRPTLLQSYRESRGLSQHQLAKVVGITQPSIWRWESGELKQPSQVRPHARANLEAFFGTPFTELLKPIDQPNGNATITQAEGI